MNETYVTVCGTVGTEPRRVSGDGWVITNFRLAHTPRRYDRGQGGWADAETNWYGVKSFRALATPASLSLRKGDRVVVHGKLRVDEWRTTEGDLRTSVFIEAVTIGHDLVFGTSSFVRAGQADRPETAGQAVADRLLREAEEQARRELLAPRPAGFAGRGGFGRDFDGDSHGDVDRDLDGDDDIDDGYASQARLEAEELAARDRYETAAEIMADAGSFVEAHDRLAPTAAG